MHNILKVLCERFQTHKVRHPKRTVRAQAASFQKPGLGKKPGSNYFGGFFLKYHRATIIGSFLFCLATSSSAQISIWRTSANTDGNLGGRAGADAFCDGDVNKPAISGSTTRAFISVDATDEIRDMPANYGIPIAIPIVRQDLSTQIAPNFPALLNTGVTPLTNSINGVAGAAGGAFTGANADGSLDTHNCSGWTSSSAANNGESGRGDATSGNYLQAGLTNCALTSTIGLFCITYSDPTPVAAGADLTEW